VRERAVERPVPAGCAVGSVAYSYSLDAGVSVLPAGAGEPPDGVVEVVGCRSRGTGAGLVGGGDVRTGGSVTGGGGTVGAGAVGTGAVGTETVGVGKGGTVGVVVVGTGSDGTVTVGSGTSIAFPTCTSACAAAKPPSATTRRISLLNRITPQTS
jgi:hypothetical protein